MITAQLFDGVAINVTDDTPAVAGASWSKDGGSWHPHGVDTLKEAYNIVSSANAEVVVDGGANAGTYAIVLARLPSVRRVYAFEPAPAVFGILMKNLELNGVLEKVVAVKSALMHVEGQCQFLLAENAAYSHTGNKMLRSHGHGKCPPLKYTTLTVSCTQLDELTIQENKVDFVKLDLEGGELKAFRGAEKLLKRDHPVLLYEYQQENASQHGYNVAEIETLLKAYGYRSFAWCGNIDRIARA